MSTTETEAPPAAESKPAAPKVNPPHKWVGASVHYWRVTNQMTGEISALPAVLIEPGRATDGWTLNFFTHNLVQGRRDVKFSKTPKAGCWTWPPKAKNDPQ